MNIFPVGAIKEYCEEEKKELQGIGISIQPYWYTILKGLLL
jgi:hypothetical protein